MGRVTIEDALRWGWGDQAQAFTDWHQKVDDVCIAKTGKDAGDLYEVVDVGQAFERGCDPTVVGEKIVALQPRQTFLEIWVLPSPSEN